MPASKKQIQANKKNAQKSTGPKTPEGKDAVRLNAVKHGLYATDLVINSPNLKENPDHYTELLDSLISDFKPKSLFELSLIRKIANCIWRSRRITAAETARINKQIEDINPRLIREYQLRFYDWDRDDPEEMKELDEVVEDEVHQLALIKSIPEDNFARVLLRYEMRLDRQLTRALSQLNAIQNRRKRGPYNNKQQKNEFRDPEKITEQTQFPAPTPSPDPDYPDSTPPPVLDETIPASDNSTPPKASATGGK
ncbi:MAG: hypothetical protein AB1483_14240 [Candidatus Zixiibacteriota bacterium]